LIDNDGGVGIIEKRDGRKGGREGGKVMLAFPFLSPSITLVVLANECVCVREGGREEGRACSSIPYFRSLFLYVRALLASSFLVGGLAAVSNEKRGRKEEGEKEE